MAEEAEFRLPDLGEGLHDAELVSWSVAVGDVVRLNQILVEVETAKAVVELPSPLAGTVIALLFEPGDTVPVGSPIIRISTDMHSDHDPKAAVLVGYGTDATPQTRRRKRRPPSVRDIATEGTPTSTVGEQDSHIGRLQLRTTPRRDAVTPSGGDAEHNGSAPTGPSRESRLRASGHRRRTAEAMTNSWRSTPHATVFVTVDLTESMAAIDYLQETARFSDLKLTPLTLTAKAALTALDEFPGLNSSWDDSRQEIVTKHHINLGIAVATPRGLIVPNVKEAQEMDLRELCRGIRDIAHSARHGTVTPTDLRGGTFTITNIGIFGVDSGTPIINPGEAAILCLGSVRKQPWVIRDELAIRLVTTIGLSFDHRIVDGEEGSKFLADVAATLADPLSLLGRL